MPENRRVVTRTRINLDDGTAETTTELLPPAGFTQRVEDLKTGLPDGGRVAARVLCDGCGLRAAVDYHQPRLPPGWTATPAGDFCPACGDTN